MKKVSKNNGVASVQPIGEGKTFPRIEKCNGFILTQVRPGVLHVEIPQKRVRKPLPRVEMHDEPSTNEDPIQIFEGFYDEISERNSMCANVRNY